MVDTGSPPTIITSVLQDLAVLLAYLLYAFKHTDSDSQEVTVQQISTIEQISTIASYLNSELGG